MVWAKGTSAVGAKGSVFLSGCTGRNVETGEIAESPAEQAKLALTNIKSALAQYGSSLENILHIWEYVVGDFPDGIINDPKWAEINGAMQDFWRENCPEFLAEDNPPASTLLGITRLALPQFHIEIMVVAAIP